MEYTLDPKKVKKRLLSLGYKNLSDFAAKNAIHRNTLNDLLNGKSVFSNAFEKVAEKLKIDPMELLVPQSRFSHSIPHIDEIKPVVAALVKKNKKMTVVLIGSRSRQRGKTFSDWDLGLFSLVSPISATDYLHCKRLAEELSEDLVRKIDVVNLNQAPLWFLENLKEGCLFLDGDHDSFVYLKGVINGIQREKQAA